MPDGYITYSTKLDNKQLEKDLARATKDVEKIESQLQKNREKRMPLAEQAADLAAKLDEAKAKLEDLRAKDASFEGLVRSPSLEKEMTAAQKTVDSLQMRYDQADARLGATDEAAKKLEDDLAAAKDRAGGIADKLAKGATAGEKMGQAISHAEGQMGKFTHRIAALAKRAFIFTVIMQGFRAIRDVMGKYVAANSEASQAIAQLKGALLTLAQPLLSVIIPAFTAFVNVLARVVAAIANLVSSLFGKSIKNTQKAAKAMYNEAEAIAAAGAAADKASGSLAAFDEINQLSDNSAGGGASAMSPDFDFDTSTVEADMEKLLGWVSLIGAGLLAWRLSDSFLGGLRIFAGLLLTLRGAMQLVSAFRDAMENGWNLKNLLESISGLMMSGLGISILTGSWIPLLVAGIASALLALTVATGHGEELITGIQQICQGFVDFIVGIFTGDIDRALTGVAGIFDGLGKAVGAVIDGLRDTLLSFLDWMDEKTGGQFHQTIEKAKGFIVRFFNDAQAFASDAVGALKWIFSGLVQFITGVFTNDWDRAWNGLKSIFKGVINGILAIFEAMVNNIIGGLNVVIRGIKKFTAFSLPDWMGGYSFKGISIPEIPRARIPRLAAGAVIPTNREFLAVLGDQKSGNNIETPEALLRKIVREEGGAGMSESILRDILAAIREGQVIVVDKAVLGKVVRSATANAARASGTSTL